MANYTINTNQIHSQDGTAKDYIQQVSSQTDVVDTPNEKSTKIDHHKTGLASSHATTSSRSQHGGTSTQIAAKKQDSETQKGCIVYEAASHNQKTIDGNAFNPEQQYGEFIARRINGMRIGGNADNTLRDASSDFGYRRELGLTTIRTVKISEGLRQNGFSMVSGVWTDGLPGSGEDSSAMSLSSDAEINLTRLKRGQFSFRDGSPTVQNNDYPEATLY